MLDVSTTHTHKNKGTQETLGDDGYIYYLDCNDDFRGVCICPNSSGIYIKNVQIFVYQLHLNKALKKISGSVFCLGRRKECGLRKRCWGDSEHRIFTFYERAIE